MKYIALAFVLVFAIAPTNAFAVCSDEGSTVVFVNGILNSETDTKQSMKFLREIFQEKFNDTSVTFIVGYNPSHLAGLGDLAQGGAQMLGGSISDFDLKTILMQIQPEIATRKILLIGHSQGTLYTNSIYNYLLSNGAPKESIAVYNVATPAREVAGGGEYLTSSNDSLISALAVLAQKTRLPAPLAPNIDIPIQVGDAASAYPGHNFIRAYLPGASDKIVSDISRELGALRAERVERAETCFTAPPSTIGYKIEGALFAVADPVVAGAISAAKTASSAGLATGEFLGNALAVAGGKIVNAASVFFAFSDKTNLPRRGGTNEDAPFSSTPSVPPEGDPTSDVLPRDVLPTEIVALQLQGQAAPIGGQVLGALTDVAPAPFAPSLPSPGFGGGMPSSSTLGVEGSQTPSVFPPEATSTATSTPAVPEIPPDEIPPVVSDVEPPDLSFEIKECKNSVSPDGCLLLDAEKLTLAWKSDAEDVDHFNIDCASRSSTSDVFPRECADFDATFASTTATSTIYTLSEENVVYKFTAKAFDKEGNESEAKEILVDARESNGTVVINEVAWRGTVASANDEWVELYNPTDKIISLAGWTLYVEADARPYIPLSGEIKPRDYFLLERTNNNTVSDIVADLIYGNDGADFALNNEGEILILAYASTTVDKTARCQQRSTFWCGSPFGSGNPSMERIDFEISGENSANWSIADSIRTNGLDANGGALVATPKARNSLHYFVSVPSTLARDKKLKKFFGEYIVQTDRTLTIPAGKTLEVEPGVTVRLGNESEIVVFGNLKANGTSDEKITFTSLSGLWKNIRIMAESAGSAISHAIFEKGGRFFNNMPLERRAMLSILGNNAPVSNSVFRNSFSVGLRTQLSNSLIEKNQFVTGTSTQNTGMIATGGAPKILNNVFSDNYQGLWIEAGSRASVENNIINDNVDYAVFSIGNAVSFKNNAGERNGKNGITLIDNIALPGEATALYANSMPYLLREKSSYSAKVPTGTSLIVGPGAVFKGENNYSLLEILGNMELRGDSKNSILFTSLADDGVIASSTLSAGAWEGIYVGHGGFVFGGGFTLRYAGGVFRCGACTGFAVDGGKVELENGLIENNFRRGMKFSNSSSTLRNFEFRDHQSPVNDSTALVSENSTLILENLIFENNLKNTSPEGIY